MKISSALENFKILNFLKIRALRGSTRPIGGAHEYIRTIVKPLWQLPPSEAKNPPTFPEQRM